MRVVISVYYVVSFCVLCVRICMAVLWSTHVEKLDVWRMEMDRCIDVSASWVDYGSMYEQ
jgi:hypothetical protein